MCFPYPELSTLPANLPLFWAREENSKKFEKKNQDTLFDVNSRLLFTVMPKMVVFSKNVHPNNLYMFIFLHCCKANSWTDNFLYIWGTSSLFNTILPSLCREICFLATRRELQEIYLCLFSTQHRFSLCRPIYTQIQISVHWKINPNKKTHFLIFSF